MKILLINSHHRKLGGAEKYYFDLAKLLRSHGHQVAFFSTNHKKNIRSKWKKYFVKSIDYDKKTFANYLAIIFRYLNTSDDRKKIKQILAIFHPDVVHINNIYYYISPYILKEIRKRNIPIVQTIHDYQIISPNINLYSKEGVSEETKYHKYYKVLLNKSVKNSLMASLFACFYSYREYFLKIHKSSVDLFITPSIFMKRKLSDYGIDKRKIFYLPNFIFNSNKKIANIPKRVSRYVLYFGKLSEHKGIFDIPKIAKMLPDVNFIMAGSTSDINILKSITAIKQKNVKVLVQPKPTTLMQLIDNCYFSICPSKWYENQPYVILESYLSGKPVVASNIGGIPEIVLNGKTGYLFNNANLKEMSKKISKLWNNTRLVNKMGKYAQRYVKNKFASEKYYDNMIEIYKNVIKSKK